MTKVFIILMFHDIIRQDYKVVESENLLSNLSHKNPKKLYKKTNIFFIFQFVFVAWEL